MVVPNGLDRFSRAVSLQYADTIYKGLWFTRSVRARCVIDKVRSESPAGPPHENCQGDCRRVGRKSTLRSRAGPQSPASNDDMTKSLVRKF